MIKQELSDICTRELGLQENQSTIERFVSRAVDVFGAEPSPYDVGNMHKVYELFALMLGSHFSHNSFYRVKRFMKILYSFFYERGIASEAMKEKVYQISASDVVENTSVIENYFASYEEIINFIDRAAEKYDCNPTKCLHDLKCIVTFAWLGILPEDMCLIKKSNLHDNYIEFRGEQHKIDSLQSAVLRQAAYADSYESFPGHQRLVYLDSEYILRSYRTAQYTRNAVKCVFNRFNTNVTPTTGKSLGFDTVRTNGIFCRALRIEASMGCSQNVAVAMASNRDRGNAHALAKLYFAWKGHFCD